MEASYPHESEFKYAVKSGDFDRVGELLKLDPFLSVEFFSVLSREEISNQSVKALFERTYHNTLGRIVVQQAIYTYIPIIISFCAISFFFSGKFSLIERWVLSQWSTFIPLSVFFRFYDYSVAHYLYGYLEDHSYLVNSFIFFAIALTYSILFKRPERHFYQVALSVSCIYLSLLCEKSFWDSAILLGDSLLAIKAYLERPRSAKAEKVIVIDHRISFNLITNRPEIQRQISHKEM